MSFDRTNWLWIEQMGYEAIRALNGFMLCALKKKIAARLCEHAFIDSFL